MVQGTIMKPNNLSQLRMEHIKRTKPQVCENGHKFIPVQGRCLLCDKDNKSNVIEETTHILREGSELPPEETEAKDYDFTRKRVWKL